MTKVELISDPQVYIDYLSSDSITVLDVNLISDDVVELHYEYDKTLLNQTQRLTSLLLRSQQLMQD